MQIIQLINLVIFEHGKWNGGKKVEDCFPFHTTQIAPVRVCVIGSSKYSKGCCLIVCSLLESV